MKMEKTEFRGGGSLCPITMFVRKNVCESLLSAFAVIMSQLWCKIMSLTRKLSVLPLEHKKQTLTLDIRQWKSYFAVSRTISVSTSFCGFTLQKLGRNVWLHAHIYGYF